MTAFDSFDLDTEITASRLLRTPGHEELRAGEALLAAAVERRWEFERGVHEAVAAYRLAGASWTQVARVLRIDEQSARVAFCRRGTDPRPAAGDDPPPRADEPRRGVLRVLRGGWRPLLARVSRPAPPASARDR